MVGAFWFGQLRHAGVLAALSGLAGMAIAQTCTPMELTPSDQPGPHVSAGVGVQSALDRALDRALGGVKGNDKPERRSMLLVALAHSHNCYASELTDEQLVSILQRTAALPPTLGPRGLRFELDVSSWVGDGLIGASGTSRRASLTYSFPADGTSWGNACGGINIILPNELGSRLTTQFGSLDRGREMVRSSLAAYRRYAGLAYTEVADDNSAMSTSSTRSDLRGDIRIGSIPLGSPTTQPLAYNAFPQGGTGGSVSACGGGDMVLNANAFTLTGSNPYFSGVAADNLYFRNTVAHEHGHGLGLIHSVPCNTTKLMEPFIYNTRALLGNDDIRGVQRNYGDRYAGNQSVQTAVDFGNLTSPSVRSVIERDLSINSTQLFIDGQSAPTNDYFVFTLSSQQQVTFTITPTGNTCASGGPCIGASNDPACCTGRQSSGCSGSAGIVNANQAGDLGFELRDSTGTNVLNSIGGNPAGIAETLTRSLTAGAYYLRVFDFGGTLPQNQTLQTYDLLIRVGTGLSRPVAIAGINKLATAGQVTQFIGNHLSYATEPGAFIANGNYAWDLDGDGTFEVNTNPQPTTTYVSNGTYAVRLRVTDSNAQTATDTINVTVRGATTSLVSCIPSSVARGQTTPVTITGTNLKGVTSASQIVVPGGNVSVTGTPVVNALGTRITGLSLVVGSSASLGPRSTSVSNADGLSLPASSATNAQFFSVAAAAGNNECAAATSIGPGPGAFPYTTSGATTSANQNCTQTIPLDVWYSWTATGTGTLSVSGDGLIGISLAAYAGTACPPATPLACAVNNPLSFPVTSGQTYLIRVGSDDSQIVGSGTLTLSLVSASGACCAADGSCSISASGACPGVFNGAASCSPNPCPPPVRACCLSGGACGTLTPGDCAASGGSAQALGSTCSPNPCPQPVGACCRGATCSVLAAAECVAPSPTIGASFVSSSQVCNGPGVFSTPCCVADFDKLAGRTIDDIFIFLNAWFASSVYCDVDAGGTVNIDDIFVFLNAWFAGCP